MTVDKLSLGVLIFITIIFTSSLLNIDQIYWFLGTLPIFNLFVSGDIAIVN